MRESIDLGAIATRLRGRLGGQDAPAIEQAARRLRVSESSVQTAIKEHEPEPDIAVLIAVVREYGVDPTWLLTGNYDLDSHRTAIDDAPDPALALMISRHLAALPLAPSDAGAGAMPTLSSPEPAQTPSPPA
jgi:hypothetical protein